MTQPFIYYRELLKAPLLFAQKFFYIAFSNWIDASLGKRVILESGAADSVGAGVGVSGGMGVLEGGSGVKLSVGITGVGGTGVGITGVGSTWVGAWVGGIKVGGASVGGSVGTAVGLGVAVGDRLVGIGTRWGTYSGWPTKIMLVFLRQLAVCSSRMLIPSTWLIALSVSPGRTV
jgi:hypothetical protein